MGLLQRGEQRALSKMTITFQRRHAAGRQNDTNQDVCGGPSKGTNRENEWALLSWEVLMCILNAFLIQYTLRKVLQ